MPAERSRALPVLVAGLLLAGVAAGCGPAVVETIGFGTGGSGCTLANGASSFASGVPVQFAATFAPDLPAGSSVAISLSRDGKDLPDLSGTVHIDVAQNCVGGGWGSLNAGHYRVVINLSSETGCRRFPVSST
jgi:hypothetical protein